MIPFHPIYVPGAFFSQSGCSWTCSGVLCCTFLCSAGRSALCLTTACLSIEPFTCGVVLGTTTRGHAASLYKVTHAFCVRVYLMTYALTPRQLNSLAAEMLVASAWCVCLVCLASTSTCCGFSVPAYQSRAAIFPVSFPSCHRRSQHSCTTTMLQFLVGSRAGT
jgi:hypothetical protein